MIRSTKVRLIALLALVLCSLALVANATPRGRQPVTTDYMVFEIDRNDVIKPVSIRQVQMDAYPTSLSLDTTPRALVGTMQRGRDRIILTVLDANDRPVFREAVDVDRYVHTESPSDGGEEPAGIWIPLEKSVFVVRAPSSVGSRLELLNGRSQKLAHISMDTIHGLRPAALSLATAQPAIQDVSNGSPSNRLDILVMGDGYRSTEAAKFQSDVNNLIEQMFTVSPYAEYRNYVNVTTYFVASASSGVDHPYCTSDPNRKPDPKEGTYVSTAFDGSFCSYGMQRLATVSESKVLSAAAAVPYWDEIFVLLNDSLYGGSGGSLLVASLEARSVDIVRHEFGHSFTGLADEYTTPNPGFPGCSDVSGSTPCEPNVTDQTTRSLIKWNPWIAASTPIPTSSTDLTHVGLFRGARYSTTSFYRPKSDCLMNHLGKPFCEICKQAFVLRLYKGKWGSGTSPQNGIDLIEPGTEKPAPGTVSPKVGDPVALSATVLKPAGGTPVSVQWLVDGVAVNGATTPSYTYTAPDTNTHAVMLKVVDQTPLVNPASAGTVLQRTRTWSVKATSTNPPPPTECTGAAGTLDNGCVRSNLSVSTAGGKVQYYIFVPAGTTRLTFTTSGGTGDADLYVRANTWPTTTTWDYRSNLGTNSETIDFTPTQTNIYYCVMVYAYAPFAGVTLRASYR